MMRGQLLVRVVGWQRSVAVHFDVHWLCTRLRSCVLFAECSDVLPGPLADAGLVSLVEEYGFVQLV